MSERNRATAAALFAVLIAVAYLLSCATAPSPAASPKADPRMFRSDEWVITTVNSFAAPDADSKGKAYYLGSAVQNVEDNDLEFLEYARMLENGLSLKGYVRVYDKNDADILVSLGYGITAGEGTKVRILMLVTADGLKNGETQSQIWKTSAICDDYSSDLRRMLAYMVLACADYFGTNTGMKKTFMINGQDPRLLDIWK
ncbi:MAG: hypothetical protein JW765_00280 [Deltaproteobacteria bacterium]|nr:hypothetical protein [Candidatus Zymogenaceae bacterium]